MSRLYDRIMQNDFLLSAAGGEQFSGRDKVAGSVVVAIDNVADLMLTYEKLAVPIQGEDFPNVAPVFARTFFEFKLPSVLRERAKGHANAVGVLADAFDTKTQLLPDWLPFPNSFVQAETRWVVHFWVAKEDREHEAAWVVHEADIFVGPDGRGVYWPSHEPNWVMVARFGRENATVQAELWDRIAVCPCLMALSFLHCKNVVVSDQQPTRADRRRAEHHGERLPVTYKTLDIRPMQTVLKHEGQIEHNGLKKALHICRGHFATYSEERPLFGHVSGTFWKPMHVRGYAKVGAVVKDYDVHRPVSSH